MQVTCMTVAISILQDTLLQHVKHVVLQTGIWTTSRLSMYNTTSPEGWGWFKDLDVLKISMDDDTRSSKR